MAGLLEAVFSLVGGNGINETVHILLVEDDPNQQNILYQYIRRMNTSIETASTEREALQKMAPADILVLDWKLSDISAQTVFERWSDVHTEKPCLIISSYLTTELHMKLLREGAYNTIEKPVDLNALSRIIDRYAYMVRQARQLSKIQEDMATLKKLAFSMMLLLAASNYEMANAIVKWIADTL